MSPLPSPPVFRVSTGTRVFMMLVAACLAVAAVIVADYLVRHNGGLAAAPPWFWCGTPVVALLCWAIVRAALRPKLELLEDRFRYTGTWRTSELPYEEVSGFRLEKGGHSSSFVMIIPASRGGRRIAIDSGFERHKELVEWIAANFKNLDVIAAGEELAEILADPRFGVDETQRSAAYTKACKCASILLVAGVGVAFWGFIAVPYVWAMGALALFPILGILTVAWSRGLVTLSLQNRRVHPSVAPTLLIPSMVLAFRAYVDCHVLGWNAFWTPFVSMVIAVAVTLAVVGGREIRKTGTCIGMAVVCLVYSYGITLQLNFLCDRTPPLIHTSRVVDRYVSHGKHESYHLVIAPWIDGGGRRQVTVPRAVYDRHGKGDPISVCVRPGFLKIPWYFVR